MEIKEVTEFPGYFVSYCGKVYSSHRGALKRKVTRVNENGYERLMLYKDKKAYQRSVHRLVAIEFCPNPESKRCVNHIDGNKLNNCADNLEWCTHQENIAHAIANGLSDPRNNGARSGEDNPTSKYTYAQIEKSCQMMCEIGYDFSTISEATGVSKATLGQIAIGRVWRELGQKYDIIRSVKDRNLLSPDVVIEVCQLLARGLRNRDVVEMTGVPKHTVGKIKNGKSYSEISKRYLHKAPTTIESTSDDGSE